MTPTFVRHTCTVSNLTGDEVAEIHETSSDVEGAGLAPDGIETDLLHEPDALAVPPDCLAVILAAGAGSRFTADDHKLATPLAKRPLLWWAVQHAVDAGFAEVVVISGAVDVTGLVPAEASVVQNHDWADGQAQSLQVASHYAAAFGYQSMIVGLGDQPYIPPQAWRLVASSTSPIAVASFRHDRTPPVKLDRDVWGLLPLDGDEGARQLLSTRPDLVVEIPCPGSPVDVDTIAGLDRVRRDALQKELGTWT